MRPHLLLAAMMTLLTISPAIAKETKAADPDKKICRHGAVATGSIMMGKPICHTAAEWTAIDRRNEQNAQDMRDHLHTGANGTASGG